MFVDKKFRAIMDFPLYGEYGDSIEEYVAQGEIGVCTGSRLGNVSGFSFEVTFSIDTEDEKTVVFYGDTYQNYIEMIEE